MDYDYDVEVNDSNDFDNEDYYEIQAEEFYRNMILFGRL